MTTGNTKPRTHAELEPITVTVDTARRLSGLGRSKIYDMIRTKQIESLTVDNRRLIVLASLRRRLQPSAA